MRWLKFTTAGQPPEQASWGIVEADKVIAISGDPFGEYQVPLAILALQQGLGRLIRHRRDRGVLAILDPRVRTKGYGRRFIASLPPSQLVHELDSIAAFFPPDGPVRAGKLP